MSNLRDNFGIWLANLALRITTKAYRERLTDQLERGQRYRVPAPRVNPKFNERAAR